MFKLLSKESNIFSIPLYIIFLFFMVISFNIMKFNMLEAISAVITFLGISLGYFCFNAIALNNQSHLPLFLYTFFIFSFYPGNLNIGIAVALLTNAILLLILTSTDEEVRKNSYLLVGAILAINFLFLPGSWVMIIFVTLHIIGTSRSIIINIFRLLFGAFLIFLSYFGLMYLLDYRSLDASYYPFGKFTEMTEFYPLYLLSPIAMMLVVTLLDHFAHYYKKSPISKYKYSFLLIFFIAQLITICMYMGENYQYLLLLALPASILLARFIKYFPKYWMQEIGLWLIIICLIIFKLADYFDLLRIF